MSEAVSPLAAFDDLMTEAEVCERYAHLIGQRELRQARFDGSIEFFTGKKGMILYRPACVAEYLERKVTRCHRPRNGSGNTATTGSGPLPTPTTSMPVGGTSEQNEHVAEVLTRKFSLKRESA
jgi:hypothetical protein